MPASPWPPPLSCCRVRRAGATEQQKLIADAEKVLSNFLRDPDMGYLQRNIGRSKALMIAPEILKAGFIFGGSGGARS
jgi:lipid-binding SYLF domain-containing protein